ncbi:MAG: response regulator [Okeania sp. SIO3B3]|nr:response regulator [Okeania sp. SIO3B3]
MAEAQALPERDFAVVILHPGSNPEVVKAEVDAYVTTIHGAPTFLLLPQALASLVLDMPQDGIVSCRFLGDLDLRRMLEDIQLTARVHRADLEYKGLLPKSDDRLGNLVDQMADGVLLVERASGSILYANPAAETLFGKTAEELRGDHFGLPIVEGDFAEIDIFCKLNILKTVEMRLGQTEWEGNDVLLASLRDITQRKQMERRLQEAIRTAEDANKAKSDFLARMSHDIRTPVSGIMGMADVALASDLPERQQGYLQTIKRSADYLLSILNDILDLSRIEAGHVLLENEPFSLRGTLEHSVSHFTQQCQEKGLSFEFDIAPSVPDAIKSDPIRLRRIVENLLSNAVKYTERGNVRLAVECLEGCTPEGSLTRLRFSIADTGVGISPDYQSRIFDIFSQGSRGTRVGKSGVGLGLGIVRQLVMLMGGQVDFDSAEGRGSVFRVVLPLPLAAPNEVRTQQELEEGIALEMSPLKLLLVEDNPVNLLFTREMLSSKGHQVSTCENGKAALAILAKEKFDVVLMDIMMPVMDGLTATRNIRDPRSSVLDHDVPVVALTAHAIKGDRERFLSEGMNDYVTKPVDFQHLFDVLARLLPDKRLERTSPKPAAGVPKTHTENLPVDREWLDKMLAGREDFLKRMFSVFLAEEPKRLDKLRQALEDMDMEQLRFLGHSTKGASATLGASGARDHAHALELAAQSGDGEAVKTAHNLLHEEMQRVFGFMRRFLDGYRP